MSTDEFSRRDIEFHRATAASYDAEITRVYGVYHRFQLEPYLDHVAAAVAHGRALDLGCGTGVISLALAKRGFDVLGVDHSEEMLAIARAKSTKTRHSGKCEFVVADVRDLPSEDGAFDCVTCQGLLHHLSDMEPCLRELRRVLRPGGYFYISEPCATETPLKRALSTMWRLRKRGRPPRAPEGPETVEAPIAAPALAEILDRLGLQYEMRFLTHIGSLRRVLPESLYLLVVRVLSFPWRRTRGDLVFIFGRKPA